MLTRRKERGKRDEIERWTSVRTNIFLCIIAVGGGDSAKQVKYEIMDTAAHASRCTGIKLIESAILEFMKEQEINLFGWLCTTTGLSNVEGIECSLSRRAFTI